MIVTIRDHEAECDLIYTNIDEIKETETKFTLYKGGFEKTFRNDLYSVIREEP